jgi:hypothetical protein
MNVFDELSKTLKENNYRLDALEANLKRMESKFDSICAKNWNVEVEIFDRENNVERTLRTTTHNVQIDGRYLADIMDELNKREEAISAKERRAAKKD